jgi:hypothetical protein
MQELQKSSNGANCKKRALGHLIDLQMQSAPVRRASDTQALAKPSLLQRSSDLFPSLRHLGRPCCDSDQGTGFGTRLVVDY